MKDSEVIELVNRHAEALNEGRGLNREVAAQRGLEARLVGELFDVAHRVHASLKPLAPRAAFVKTLKQSLLGEARTQLAPEAADRQHWLLLAAGLGGLIYLGSAMVLGVKASLWVLGILATLLGWKKGQAGRRRPSP
jgi:hypothetical protein